MRKIIFAINMTLDGCFDHTAVIADDELHEKAAALFRSADVVLYGRVTYQLMADYWPAAAADASLSPGVREFTDAINGIPKIVFSKTLQDVSWDTTILRAVDAEEIRAMKSRPGKDILLGGGGKIAREFMNLGLIDEYRLIVQPIILGKGKRLFADLDARRDFQLIGQDVRRSGAVELIYKPVYKSNNP
jgi:dihydrofolate reductase